MTRTLVLALVLALACGVLAALVAGGCGSDDSVTPTPERPPLLLDNPDSVMAHLKAAYSAMDLAAYREVLHSGYRFLFDPTDAARLNQPNGDYLRSEDLGGVANLFSGQVIHRGEVSEPAVEWIKVTRLDRVGEWADTGTSDADFPHTLSALFDVEFSVVRDVTGSLIIVSGQQRFYMVSHDAWVGGVGGVLKPCYLLCGQRDLTSRVGKAVEPDTWGGLKSRYYTGPAITEPDLFPRSFPSNPDTLLARFRRAYAGMDIDNYRHVLDGGFRFLFNPVDVTRLNLPASFFTREEDLHSTINMFSGNSLPTPEGLTIPGVAQIRITQWDRVSAWVDEGPDNPDFPNTRRAMFDVALYIARVSNATTLDPHGQEEFFVSARDSTRDGITRPYYQLRGQRDWTTISGKWAQSATWGTIKALWGSAQL